MAVIVSELKQMEMDMTTKNGDMPAMSLANKDMPAMPQNYELWCLMVGECPTGLTKREMFCLHNGVADTGDDELDAIIRKGNRQKMAMHMMASLTNVYWDTIQEYETGADLVKCQSETAVEMSDALLAELERTNG